MDQQKFICRELFNMYCSCIYIKDFDVNFDCYILKEKLEKCIKENK